MIETAVVLAVGSQHHQSQLTYSRPRAMLPVLGKPLIVRIMDLFHRAGIKHYIVVIGQEEGSVASYLNTQWAPDIKIDFVLQTGNSNTYKTLSDIARQHTRPFILTTYNSFVHPHFPDRLLKQHNDSNDVLILSGANTTLSKSTDHYFAAVEKQMVRSVSKGHHIAEGVILTNLVICGQDFVDYLINAVPGTGSFGKQLLDIVMSYVESGGKTEIAETSWLLEIETDPDLLILSKFLLELELDTHILSELPGTIQIIPPVRIDPNVSVGQGAKIGPYAYLESGCSVGSNAIVQNALILQNSIVQAKETISNMIIASKARISVPAE